MDPVVRDVGALQSWNGYGYVEGRVASWTDPTGFAPFMGQFSLLDEACDLFSLACNVNLGLDLRKYLDEFIPGAYFSEQAQIAWQQDKPLLAATYGAASFAEAAIAVFGGPTLPAGRSVVTRSVVGGLVDDAARGTTTLYRSVSAAEHADIAATGVLRAGPNSFEEGKWFAESAEHAQQWGRLMDGPGNFGVIEVTFPRSVADQFLRNPMLDGIGPARFGTFEQFGNPIIELGPGP